LFSIVNWGKLINDMLIVKDNFWNQVTSLEVLNSVFSASSSEFGDLTNTGSAILCLSKFTLEQGCTLDKDTTL
jgi:hypothetical protein